MGFILYWNNIDTFLFYNEYIKTNPYKTYTPITSITSLWFLITFISWFYIINDTVFIFWTNDALIMLDDTAINSSAFINSIFILSPIIFY